jgi:RNA polymerase sigma-70 factor (ECF subfamily)
MKLSSHLVREHAINMPGRAEFDQLVLPHLAAAYNLARWLAGDATLAEDIVQDGVLRALAAFDGFRGGDPRAWLLRIVRNTAYDSITARRKRATAELDEAMADPADDPEASFGRVQQQGRLAERLSALPTDLRECLVLRELEGLSYKQVSAVTGVPIGTVMSRLWRARRALVNDLGRP